MPGAAPSARMLLIELRNTSSMPFSHVAIAKPQLVAVADWTFDAQTTPACGDFLGGERAMKKARRPDPARAVFLANQDFGPQFCWATGSLITAERVLMDLAVPPPTWLNASWYAARVASLP